jgi:hypothetical protein
LIAQCQGPNTLAYCELVDHRDGTFTLHITPKEPGRHTLDIQYGGDPVPGKSSVKIIETLWLQKKIKQFFECHFLICSEVFSISSMLD